MEFKMTPKHYFIVFSAALVILLSMGTRHSFGLFQTPISEAFGIGLTAFSFSLALQNLLWGLSQPFIGAIADKYGTGRVIAVAGAAQVLGLVILANADSIWQLHVSTGVIIGIAGSGSTWAVLMSVVARNVPEHRRTFFFGLTSAMGTGGQILIAPLSQTTINAFGWVDALLILAVMLAVIVPLAYVLKGKTEDMSVKRAQAESLVATLHKARRHSGYLYLISGFFVCGFHVMFIAAHLPNYLLTLDMPDWLPGTAISLIGITNLAGTMIFGWLGDRYSKKYLLSSLYFMRSLVIAAFSFFPISPISVLLFAGSIGFLWLATVPLTHALVGQMFGIKYLATLAGIVFASHQVGSFISVWLGGWLFDTTSSYDLIWQLAIGLGLLAALLHLPIKDEPKETPQPQPAE
ncbi:MAG: MFS transporter [Rhodospirillaceae bacterium]|nr:MFS transporter [Rhodospirillaceae bacterium]